MVPEKTLVAKKNHDTSVRRLLQSNMNFNISYNNYYLFGFKLISKEVNETIQKLMRKTKFMLLSEIYSKIPSS